MVISIKKSEIYVWLSKGMFTDLKFKISEHNENQENKVKLNLGIAAYFLNLPNYLSSIKKDKYEDGWIPICSEIYKNIKNSSKYFQFLIENEFLKIHPKNYSTATNSCKRYRLGKKYDKHVLNFQSIKVDKTFHGKRLEKLKKRQIVAQNSTKHLTKWLDKSNLFSVEYEKAIAYINETFQGSSQVRKKNCRIIALDNFKYEIVRYSREGKDNRLHSILSSMPKDLRQFLKYNKKNLVSIDITNSQPFIFATILDGIISKSSNKLFNNYLSNNNKSITNMFDLVKNKNKIKEFISEIISGGFYYAFGDKLYKEGALMTKPNDYYYFADYKDDKKNRGLKIKEFKNRREAAKHIMMKILFTSKNYNGLFLDVFNKYYPEVCCLLKTIKTNNKSDLPVLLQNIEADFILDYCTRRTASKHPVIPLYTIHDSVLTTDNYIDLLEEEFKSYLAEYFKITPALKIEYWNGN